LSGVVDQHPTRTPVVLHWLPLVATRLHTHAHDPNQPAARVVKIKVSFTCQFQAFHIKNLQTNCKWTLPSGCRRCLLVTYLSDHDRSNVAWTSLVFDGEQQPIGTRACIHRKGNVLSSIFTWDPAPAHNVGSLSTVLS
jgi:hypothetical protein